MRRNVTPIWRFNTNSTQRDILTHLTKIQSILNAPSRNINQNIKPTVERKQESSSDDDSDDSYFDDQIMNDSSSSSDSESQIDEIQLRKQNRDRAATPAQIKTLPRAKVEVNLQGVCAICLEQWKIRQIFSILPCAHRFHENCVRDWLIQKNSCPCCNSVVF